MIRDTVVTFDVFFFRRKHVGGTAVWTETL